MKKPKIVYYYDALCGWCYGFSPVLGKIHKEYKDLIDFEVISGGLFLRNRIGLINEVAPHIQAGAYKSVEATSNVKFGSAFLNGPLKDGTMVLNSIPPAVALCIVKDKCPEKAIDFAAILLKAIYYDGMHPEDINVYEQYAAQIGIDIDDFSNRMKDSTYMDRALIDFSHYNMQQINGFPSLVLESGNSKTALSRGYMNYDSLKKNLDHYLSISE